MFLDAEVRHPTTIAVNVPRRNAVQMITAPLLDISLNGECLSFFKSSV